MTVEILQGDCIEVLRKLPAESVNCCVTSPPYWGLRDYGTAKWEGGDPECDHKIETTDNRKFANGRGEVGEEWSGASLTSWTHRDATVNAVGNCPKCGATRIDSQLGLEPTPDEYLAKMVDVFREVRRVLRDDGTLWLNLGDTYAGSWGAMSYAGGDIAGRRFGGDNGKIGRPVSSRLSGDLKPKDLVGIPWMFAFALRADGWWLRQDIIWHKPNPMPESVTDRCTKAHEYIFLLSKSEKYYYNSKAIAEEGSGLSGGACIGPQTKADQTKHDDGHANIGGGIQVQSRKYDRPEYVTRNKRSVWTVTTKPYKAAHFATFPPDLIQPCILAGCPEGGTVLDPFLGSGTTAMVAQRNGCRCIGIELNPEYVKLAEKRIRQRMLL